MADSDPLLIYGATGYTGRLLARAAREQGRRPVLCSRNEARLAELAVSLGLEYRVARLDSGTELAQALRGMKVVIHAAGPFGTTHAPMVEAALHAGVHYVDLSGEWAAIEGVRRYGAQARQRGVMLMPAAGFDVVPSDCLALHVASRVPGARHLVIAVSGLELYSRGSVRTLGEFAGDAVRVRRNGALVTVPPGSLQRTFDFGAGPRPAYALSWADVSTAYYTTGIPNIEVYYEANPLLHANLAINRWLGALARNPFMRMGFDAFVQALPDGPSDMERAGRRAVVIAEADGLVRSRLWTPEAYGFTCTTSLAIAQRVMAGNLEPGFQTPARVYGADWILGLPGVHREDALPSASTASAPATRLT